MANGSTDKATEIIEVNVESNQDNQKSNIKINNRKNPHQNQPATKQKPKGSFLCGKASNHDLNLKSSAKHSYRKNSASCTNLRTGIKNQLNASLNSSYIENDMNLTCMSKLKRHPSQRSLQTCTSSKSLAIPQKLKITAKKAKQVEKVFINKNYRKKPQPSNPKNKNNESVQSTVSCQNNRTLNMCSVSLQNFNKSQLVAGTCMLAKSPMKKNFKFQDTSTLLSNLQKINKNLKKMNSVGLVPT